MNPYIFNFPYNMPYIANNPNNFINMGRMANQGGMFSRLANSFGAFRRINWSNLLNNTSKTLGVINQAIPIVKREFDTFYLLNLRKPL